jgi:protease II
MLETSYWCTTQGAFMMGHPVLFTALVGVLLPASDAQTIAPGANLVAEGIPPIPLTLAEGVDRYTQYRRASFAGWHPTRRQMLIRTRFGEALQAHRVQFPEGARTQLTFFRDGVGSVSFQPTNGDCMLFAKDRGGDEMFQIYKCNLATGTITLLTDGHARNTGGVWSQRSGRLAYGSTRRTGKDVDLYVIDPGDPKSDRLVARLTGGGWIVKDWALDDRTLLVWQEISARETYLWLCDVSTGALTPLTPQEGKEKVAYGHAVFSKDGKSVYLTTDKGSEFQQLAVFDLATHTCTPLTGHIPWDVDEFMLSSDGATIAFLTNDAGNSVLHLLDTASRKEKAVPPMPQGIISGIIWHKNGIDLGFTLNNVRAPSDAYSLNVQTGKVERWTASETGGVPLDNLPDPELIRWKSFDGRDIGGFLYAPPPRFAGKRPVIIYVHGGPESQLRPEFFGPYNYYLNELGIALLCPNIRGSTGYGKTFLDLDNGFRREDAYKDMGALLDWIGSRDDLDANRIMVTGGSYGGHVTLAMAAFYSDKIRCAVDIAGPSNLATFLAHTSSYRQDLRRVEYGDERDPKLRAFLNRIAPLNHVDKIKKPLLIVQGQNDPRCPRSEAEQMVAALRASGTPVWYLMARDEGHGFHKKKNADFQFYATVLFVQQFLLN